MRATTLATALAALLLIGCAPQAIPYAVDGSGLRGVWIMPKGAQAPIDGFLMDSDATLYLLTRAGIINTEGVPRAMTVTQADGRIFLVAPRRGG